MWSLNLARGNTFIDEILISVALMAAMVVTLLPYSALVILPTCFLPFGAMIFGGA